MPPEFMDLIYQNSFEIGRCIFPFYKQGGAAQRSHLCTHENVKLDCINPGLRP